MENKNEQTDLNAKKKVIIWSGSALLVFILLLFSIWMLFEKIKKGSDNFFSQKTEIALLESQSSEIENFKKKYDSYLPNLQKIDQAFVDPQSPLKFIEFLEQSALSAKVDLEISPMSFSKEGDSKILSLQLNSKGDFSDILIFLKEIEEGPYLLSIQNLTIANFESPKSGAKAPVKKSQASFSVKVLTQ